jgi:hypothetical protein
VVTVTKWAGWFASETLQRAGRRCLQSGCHVTSLSPSPFLIPVRRCEQFESSVPTSLETLHLHYVNRRLFGESQTRMGKMQFSFTLKLAAKYNLSLCLMSMGAGGYTVLPIFTSNKKLRGLQSRCEVRNRTCRYIYGTTLTSDWYVYTERLLRAGCTPLKLLTDPTQKRMENNCSDE